MVFRGQIARKIYRSNLQGVAIGRNDPIPVRAERVSGILLGRRPVAPSIFSTPIRCRNYADRPISRPKAHTGRTTSSPRRKDTVKSTDAADPKVNKAKPKAKAVPTAKTQAKTKPKAKSKGKSKAKPKPKPKSKPKKISKSHIRGRPRMTEKQLEARKATNTRLKIAELKAKALLTRPKILPASAFSVILVEECKVQPSVGQGARNASVRYKAITPEQLEVLKKSSYADIAYTWTNISQHYNHIANQNKSANEAAHKKWIESHTPLEIAEANLARSQLRNKYNKRIPVLRDERLVSGRLNPYIIFTKERMTNEDFKNIPCPDRARLIGKEWKNLSEAEKKVRFFLRQCSQLSYHNLN